MYGADSDELRRIAQEMFRAADELDADQGFLSSTLFGVPWLGDVASMFIERWTGVCVPNVNRSIDFLRESSENLNRQATEQDDASAADGGSIGATIGGSIAGGTGASTGDSSGGSTLGETDSSCGGEREGDPLRDDRQKTCTWPAPGGDSEAKGRAVIDQALRDTMDSSLIAKDEFEIIQLENGKYIVVLPGVTDMSAWFPWIGKELIGMDAGDSPWDWDPVHGSVRDMDQAAMASAGNTDIMQNLYAQFVIQEMDKAGIPPGADVMLVGHSYGADTVMDLANDASFNGGPNGYNVTHVVAAAYNTDGQWDGIPDGTQVLSIQNTGDAVVGMEHVTEGMSQARYGAGQVWDGIGSLSPSQVGSGLKDLAVGSVTTAFDAAVGGAYSAYDAIPRTTNHGDGQNNITFWGGTGTDIGHHPDRYADYISGTDHQAVQEFAQSVADSGYDVNGQRWAHDVSVVE